MVNVIKLTQVDQYPNNYDCNKIHFMNSEFTDSFHYSDIIRLCPLYLEVPETILKTGLHMIVVK
jgi:hypothetical protein